MIIEPQLHRACANCSDESELAIEWDAGGRLYLCRRCLQELIITSMKKIKLSEEEYSDGRPEESF